MKKCPHMVVGTCLACTMHLLTGCATQPASTVALNYVRTDGRPNDIAQMASALAQCQAEGARSVDDQVYAAGVSRSSKETAITNACMARNGYLAQ